MKNSFIVAGLCSLLVVACKRKPEPVPEPAYRLVWSDEFDYTGLPDSTRWTYQEGYIRNQEVQYYQAKRLKNSRVENGNLLITAVYDTTETHPVSSASLVTLGKADFLYGKMEVRAKLPTGKGAWPAIWTLGTNRYEVGWPASGEIDIMEWLGWNPLYVYGSLHKADASGKDAGHISISPAIPDLSDAFHTYVLEWDEKEIRISVDNFNYAVYRASDMPAGEWQPFTKPHFLLLNLALGGTSGLEVDYSKFPFTFTVDYVRYYKKE